MSEKATNPVIKPAVGLKDATPPSDPHGIQRLRKKQRVEEAFPVIEHSVVFKEANSSFSDQQGKQRLKRRKRVKDATNPVIEPQ